jgi:orotidine-5'-phosphate decarboxylase
MADLLVDWSADTPGELAFVVGATDSGSLAMLRKRHPEIPLLIPGIGAQGGDAKRVVEAAHAGSGPVIVNSSRAILYAGHGIDFADRAAEAARRLRTELNEFEN